MKKRRTLDDIIRFTTAVGESTVFTGSFSGGENFVIRGKVSGNSEVKGAVVVAETGIWVGKLRADVIVIAGRVEGEIEANEKLEVRSGAQINGRIHCPVIAMATGSVHEGEIEMRNKTALSHFDEKRLEPVETDEDD